MILRATPLYQQIARHFEERICDGRLPAGSRLATTAQLAKEFSVNAETIHNALGLLAERGLIERRRAAGSFVRHGVGGRTVAVVFGENNFTRIDRAFFNAFLDRLTRQLAGRGWNHRHYIATEIDQSDRAFSDLQRDVADGTVRAVVEFCSNKLIGAWLESEHCPVPVRQFPLWIDALDLLAQALAYLLARGRRNIAVLFGYQLGAGSPAAYQSRVDEVLARHADPSVRVRFVDAGGSLATAHAAGLALLDGPDRPDAIASLDDTLTRGVIYAVLQRGLRIPEDLALITHANKGVEMFCHVPLTRLEADPELFAVRVVDELQARIDGIEPDLTPLRAALVPGLSCGETP